MKIEKIVKVLALFVLIFVKQIALGQPWYPHAKILSGPQDLTTEIIKKICETSVEEWQRNNRMIEVNGQKIKVNVRPDLYLKEFERMYNKQHANRVLGFESSFDLFRAIENLEETDGEDIDEGIDFISNSGVGIDGFIHWLSYERVNKKWKYFTLFKIPMFKKDGGAGHDPCANLLDVMLADDFGKVIPEKEKIKETPEVKKDFMTEPCSGIEYEMAEWYMKDGQPVGKYTAKYSNIYWRARDDHWLQLNGSKWDTLCPVKAKPIYKPTTTSFVSSESDCEGNIYFQEKFFGPNGQKMFNGGEVMKDGYRWYRKGSDGVYREFCKIQIANDEKAKSNCSDCSETRTNKTSYTYFDEHYGCARTRSCDCRRDYACSEHYNYRSSNGGSFWLSLRSISEPEPAFTNRNNGERRFERNFTGEPSMGGSEINTNNGGGNSSMGGSQQTNNGGGNSSMGGGRQDGVSIPVPRRR